MQSNGWPRMARKRGHLEPVHLQARAPLPLPCRTVGVARFVSALSHSGFGGSPARVRHSAAVFSPTRQYVSSKVGLSEIVILFGLARRTANKSEKVSLFYKSC